MTLRHLLSIALFLGTFVWWPLASRSQDPSRSPKNKSTDQLVFSALHGVPRGPNGSVIKLLVEPGTRNRAEQYYLRIERGDVDTDADGDIDGDDDSELNFNLVADDGSPQAALDNVLEYLGYRNAQSAGVTADRIERFSSDDQASFERFKAAVAADGGDPSTVKSFADGDITATRYFAPKITDVAREREYFQYGWRKLVRLKALDGSEAKARGILSGFLLFNVFATEAHLNATSPFNGLDDPTQPNRSQQNQLILVRNPQSPGRLDDTVYWMVFGALPAGQLGFTLNASFDYRHPQVTLQRPTKDDYFVPDACADCHGDLNVSKGKLNYLDTDHWFDRVKGVPAIRFVDDFGAIAQTPHGVLLDGGKDEGSDAFRIAFERVKTINSEILDQNRAVDSLQSGPVYDAFPTRSVERWLQIHASNVQHVGILDDLDNDGIVDRAISGAASTPNPGSRWRKNDRVDEALLPLMNRYCYRCHSSLRYSIYDRARVRNLSSSGLFPNANRLMQIYLSDPTQSLEYKFVPFMPQDRPMNLGTGPSDRVRLVDLLDRMID